MKRLLALAALACAALRPALAKDPDIPFAEFRLDNGLRVIVHEDHKAPIVAVNVWYHVGSKNEPPGKTGFAHLFEHLMFNGSENYNDEYFRPFEQVGATEHERHDELRPHELLRERADDARSTWRCGWNRTAWAICSARSTRRSSTSSAASCRTRSAQGENQPYGSVDEQIVAQPIPPGHPYSLATRSARWRTSTPPRSTTSSEWFRPTTARTTRRSCSPATSTSATAQGEGASSTSATSRRARRSSCASAGCRSGAGEQRIVMQDRVPQARIYKVWRGPRMAAATIRTLLELADAVLGVRQDLAAVPAARIRRPDCNRRRGVPDRRRDRGRLRRIRDGDRGQDLAAVEHAVDEEMARFLRDGPTRTELERVRAELKGSVRPRDRAGRRVPWQVEHPRRERGVRRPPRFLQALARRDERRDARAGARDRAPLAHGQCARARSPTVPDHARRRQGRCGSD